MKSRQELKELIDFLRAEGVTMYEQDGVRLTLLPQKPLERPLIEQMAASRATEQQKVTVFAGLTSEECVDLFNAQG